MFSEVDDLIDMVGSTRALSARFSTELKIYIWLMNESKIIKMAAYRWIFQ
jgi:hypothetical protein